MSLFFVYTVRISQAPHLVGPALYIGTFSQSKRRLTVLALFLFAATIILLCAERFAEVLVEAGAEFGISEFLLQWLAPLASEAPEAIVPESWHGAELVVVGVVYLLLAATYVFRQRHAVPHLMRDGLRTNYAELTRS